MHVPLATLLALSGCSLVFPLREDDRKDAGIDAVDAPIGSLVCPSLGTAPRFVDDLETRLTTCDQYTEALDGRGLATCGAETAEVTLDGTVISIPGLVTDLDTQYKTPRLTPDGEQLLVVVRDNKSAVTTVQTSFRANGVWTSPQPVRADADPDLLSLVISIGTPTATTPRRLMIDVADGIREVELDGLMISNVKHYVPDELGVTVQQTPNLTSDGLRAVFDAVSLDDGIARVYYSDRSSIDEPFGTALPIDTAPVSTDVFMTSDCARIYVGTAGKVLFARQQ